MLNHDAAESPLASYEDDPAERMDGGKDDVEETPEQREKRIERETYREASENFLSTMMGFINFLHEARDLAEQSARLWVISSAIDHPCVDGFSSNTEIAEKLGITRADYSKHLVTFQRRNSLPPSAFQKRVTAREAYRKSRKSQLNGSPA